MEVNVGITSMNLRDIRSGIHPQLPDVPPPSASYAATLPVDKKPNNPYGHGASPGYGGQYTGTGSGTQGQQQLYDRYSRQAGPTATVTTPGQFQPYIPYGHSDGYRPSAEKDDKAGHSTPAFAAGDLITGAGAGTYAAFGNHGQQQS